jgi:gas vesicle protein
MANILNDTMNAAKNVLDTARDNAEQAAGTAKVGAEHAVESTRSALFEGIRAVTGLVATLRSFDADDALGRIGLERRRSVLYDLAIFGAGVAVGTGVSLMLAPMSGQRLRAMILDQLHGAKAQAEESMKQAERKIENKVGAGVEAAKDAVLHQVGTAAGNVQEMAEEARMASQKARTGLYQPPNGRQST